MLTNIRALADHFLIALPNINKKLTESRHHRGCSTRTYNPIDPTNGIWSAKVTRKCHVPRYYHGPASEGISMSIVAQTPRLR